jgi:hypothetical protein
MSHWTEKGITRIIITPTKPITRMFTANINNISQASSGQIQNANSENVRSEVIATIIHGLIHLYSGTLKNHRAGALNTMIQK